MALITSLEKKPIEKSRWRTTTAATYAITEDLPGHPIVHLTTYGSSTRQNKESGSQIIQIDRTHAAILVKILLDKSI